MLGEVEWFLLTLDNDGLFYLGGNSASYLRRFYPERKPRMLTRGPRLVVFCRMTSPDWIVPVIRHICT